MLVDMLLCLFAGKYVLLLGYVMGKTSVVDGCFFTRCNRCGVAALSEQQKLVNHIVR